jgi:CheY-like chemotaxis protein
MQGHVQCESAPQRGSRFTVTVPLAPWQPAEGAARQPASQRSPIASASARAAPAGAGFFGLGRRVLLAEDHPVNREVVTRQLAKLGYETECAEDGQQAWDKLLAEGADYDLLLTDCHMPRLDGYQLATRVRAREAELGLPRLPIVALTANALQGEAEHCLALGMDAYLSKPTRVPQLQQVLEDAIGRGPAAGGSGRAVEAPAPPPYPRLLELCEGDTSQLVKLLRSFASVTTEDLRAMAQAAEADDLGQLQGLAHRMRSACHQLDEPEAVAALEALESIDDRDAGALTRARVLHQPAHDAVTAALARARNFIQQQEFHAGSPPGRREQAPADQSR